MKPLGTIRLAGRQWAIKAEPHVSIRLKRLFARLDRHAVGVIHLADTEEVARDLLWFMERYPLDAGKDEEYLRRRASAHRERETAIERLLTGEHAPVDLNGILAEPAREYQLFGAAMADVSGGLLLADEVGLGKTVTALCSLLYPDRLPALVVTLAHLPRQWEREINRFAPRLKTHVLRSATPYDLRLSGHERRKAAERAGQLALLAPSLPDVIIGNYHKLAGWADVLPRLVRSVVYDEVQELRHDGTGKSNAAREIRKAATFAMGLSATPIHNYGGEFYNVMEQIRPGALGTREEFLREWCAPAGTGQHKLVDPRAFGVYARSAGFMLRRTRHEVGRELPPLSKITQEIDAEPNALRAIEGSAAELARLILMPKVDAFRKWQASEEFSNKLRQATGIAKAPFVADFARILAEQGEPVVLYGWHRAVYDVWTERLRDLSPRLYTGTESPAAKDAAVRAFLDGSCRVLILSLRAGAGLDGLQKKARTVIFGELDWSPAVHEQCIGRVFRDGQPDPVVAFYLVADKGSDPVVADVLGLKKEQSDGILTPEGPAVRLVDRAVPAGEGAVLGAVDSERVKRLAAAYLTERGIALPRAEPEEAPAEPAAGG